MSASIQSNAGGELHEDWRGLVICRFTGEIDEKTMREAVLSIRRCAETTGRVYALCDFRGAISIGPAARKTVVNVLHDVRVDAGAVIGASFHIRVLVLLITKGLQAFMKRTYPLMFFDTEAEARAWLLEQMRAHRD